MNYNEAETRAFLVQPVLEQRGWSKKNLSLERDVQHYLRRRLSSGYRRADYILLNDAGEPIGIIEVKRVCGDELKLPGILRRALAQAQEYALAVRRKLTRLSFLFATDGTKFVENSISIPIPDSLEELAIVPIDAFPTPQMLSQRLAREQVRWGSPPRRRSVSTGGGSTPVFVQGYTVYHRRDCEYLKRRSIRERFPDAMAAELAGYYPCSYCDNR